MFWLMLGAAVIGAGASIYKNAQTRKNARTEIAHQLDQNELAARKANIQESVATAQAANELTSAKVNAESDVTTQMEQTYLGQLAQEREYQDMMQQGGEAEGALRARTVAAGIQGGTTLQQITRDQIGQSLASKRTAIDKGLGSAIGNVDAIAANFQAGSSYMNLYQGKLDAMKGEFALAQEGLTKEKTFLEDKYDSYTYNGSWFLQDAFSIVGSGLDFASGGVKNGWWK